MNVSSYRSKVLIVDDKRENLLVLRLLLSKSLPVDITEAMSGEEAIERASSEDFAVILLDVQMPIMSGIEVAKHLRNQDQTKLVPIIFVTANSRDPRFVAQGYASGAIDYLFKPIDSNILLSKVGIFVELEQYRRSQIESQKKLQLSQSELERSNDALRVFSHTVAHDIKAPLRQMRMWSEIISEDDPNISQDTVGFLNSIRTSATRLQKLIDGLLEYAQVNAKQPLIDSIDLNQLVHQVCSEFSAIGRNSNATFEIGSLPKVRGNTLMMHQLFTNIIGNALKYRKKNVPPEIKVCCFTDSETEMHQISIRDNGIGFEKSDAKRIFEPFQRLAVDHEIEDHEIEGHGIGMATVKKIVEMHQGDIRASGNVGEGSTFTVSLPTKIELFDQLSESA